MKSVAAKFREMTDLLDSMRIRRDDLDCVIEGTKSLSERAAVPWTHAALAFNGELAPLLKESMQLIAGLKVIVADDDPAAMVNHVKKALLYTDFIVVYSGGECAVAYDDILSGIRRGGVLCDGIPELFRDLLILRPVLTSGFAACVQKHYFDPSPDGSSAKWVLTDLKRDRRLKIAAPSESAINPYSVYADFVRPDSMDCINFGNAFGTWSGKRVKAMKSAQQLLAVSVQTMNLPHIANVPLEALIELRQDEPEAFAKARTFIANAVRECLQFDVAAVSIEDFARHLHTQYIDNAQKAATEGMSEAVTRKYLRRFSPIVSTLSLTINACLGNVVGIVIDALNLGQQGLSEFVETKAESRARGKNDLYLFSQIEQLARKQGAT